MHPLNKEQEKRKKTNKQGLNIVILKFETADTLKISVLSELAHIPYLYFPHVFLVIKNLNPATKIHSVLSTVGKWLSIHLLVDFGL